MAWYYYSGPVTRPVRVSSTKSVAVRPNSKIEILEVTPDVQALIRSGCLRRTGRPLGAQSIADQEPAPQVKMKDVLQRSSLAQHFAEKGVTTSSVMPPTKTVGAQEYTVHELAMDEADQSAPVGASSRIAADLVDGKSDSPDASDGLGRRWKKRHRDQ